MHMKKIFVTVIFVLLCQCLFSYEIASSNDSNLSYQDIINIFIDENKKMQEENKHYVFFNSYVYTSSSKQCFSWTVQKEDDAKKGKTKIILWFRNGYFQITYYAAPRKFIDGTSTWNIKKNKGKIDFHRELCSHLETCIAESRLKLNEYGIQYSSEEEKAFDYLLNNVSQHESTTLTKSVGFVNLSQE